MFSCTIVQDAAAGHDPVDYAVYVVLRPAPTGRRVFRWAHRSHNIHFVKTCDLLSVRGQCSPPATRLSLILLVLMSRRMAPLMHALVDADRRILQTTADRTDVDPRPASRTSATINFMFVPMFVSLIASPPTWCRRFQAVLFLNPVTYLLGAPRHCSWAMAVADRDGGTAGVGGDVRHRHAFPAFARSSTANNGRL